MKVVYDFDFNKVSKQAEALINNCVDAKRGRKYVHLYITINGEQIEINEPVSITSIEIRNSDNEAFWKQEGDD